MKRLLLLSTVLLAMGCSSQAQMALARTSVAQARAAEARIDLSQPQTAALEQARASLHQADTMLAKGERGEFGPLAKTERLNDTWMQGEIATASFLQVGAEQQEELLRQRYISEKLLLQQELQTLEDYRLFLTNLQKVEGQ